VPLHGDYGLLECRMPSLVISEGPASYRSRKATRVRPKARPHSAEDEPATYGLEVSHGPSA
jgi:hypothetical protein